MERYLLHQEVEFVNKILGQSVQPGKLLDLCCGTGEVSLMLQTQGFRTIGLDKNQLALAAFRQHSQELPLVQGDALNLPFWDESFDTIVALHCFDLLDRIGFLQECNRLLRYGGLLVFDALNRHSYKLILKRLGRFVGTLFVGNLSDKWIDVFSYREVLQLIGQVGFDQQAACGYSWAPFPVNSNCRLVTTCAYFERILQLNRYSRVSPRIIIAVRKKPNQEAGLAFRI